MPATAQRVQRTNMLSSLSTFISPIQLPNPRSYFDASFSSRSLIVFSYRPRCQSHRAVDPSCSPFDCRPFVYYVSAFYAFPFVCAAFPRSTDLLLDCFDLPEQTHPVLGGCYTRCSIRRPCMHDQHQDRERSPRLPLLPAISLVAGTFLHGRPVRIFPRAEHTVRNDPSRS